MAENFTAKQKEIVARKLGYDGPMQGFDDFLNSSPALSMKYATLTDKFAQRMAKGGMARKKYAAGGAVTDQQVAQWLSERPGLSDQEIRGAMEQFNVSPEQLSRATGVSQAEVQSRYDAAIKPAAPKPAPAAPKPAPAAPKPAPAAATFTDDQVRQYLSERPGLTDQQIAAEMNRFGVDTAQMSRATGVNQAEVQQRFDAATKPAAATTPATGAGAVTTGGTVDAQVIVYGPDGTMYSNPRSAIDAGVTNYKTTRPTDTGGTTGTKAAVTVQDVKGYLDANPGLSDKQIADKMKETGATVDQVAAATGLSGAEVQNRFNIATGAGGVRSGSGVTFSDTGKPIAGEAAQVSAAQIVATPEQNIDTANRAGAAETATVEKATATTADAPTTVSTSTYDATQSAANIGQLMAGVSPAMGSITDENLVRAEQMDPTSTALANIQAAQGVANTVQGAPTRTEQAGEMVAGTAVDQSRAEALAAQTAASAAQGVVTEEMTVQGQLNKLMTDFEAGNPPPWAAANLRAVTATLSARGLGASSLAGQALIQATLESALPIASADAQAYQSVAAQNLSNRQQTAVLAAQQRAAFMGQEFDQEFQTRVVNAAKVSDIANMNFTAQQQVALENARLAQTMDLANLSNNQAMVMANAAQIASLETTNLNNRQQAAVVNAQSFLQMDMANLSNMQQTTLFRAQQMTQAMLSDTAADNAAKQFNSTSTNQTNQFNTQIATQVSQFNSAQQNAIAQFNTDQANAISKFNAEVKNQRETFNAQQRLVIDQANAQWQREIATANTAATNAANIINAQLSQQMTMAEYNNETQMYRDDVAHVWQSAENDASRATQLAAAEISAAASISAANIKADAESSAATGSFVARVLSAVL
jgi:hypothetical protein